MLAAQVRLPPGVPVGVEAAGGLPRPAELDGPLGRLSGHRATVRAVAFSPDGRLLASGSDDGTVVVWDVTEVARPVRAATLTQPRAVRALGFGLGGRLLVTGGLDGTVLVWDLTDPTRPAPAAAPVVLSGGGMLANRVDAVAVAPDSCLVAAGGRGGAALWDLTGSAWPRPIATLAGHRRVHAVGFAPGGGLLATGGEQIIKHCLIVWDITDPAHPTRTVSLPVGSDSTVHALGFSPNGRLLGSCSDRSGGRSCRAASGQVAAGRSPAPVTRRESAR